MPLSDIEKMRLLLANAELKKNGKIVIDGSLAYSPDGNTLEFVTADECMKSVGRIYAELLKASNG